MLPAVQALGPLPLRVRGPTMRRFASYAIPAAEWDASGPDRLLPIVVDALAYQAAEEGWLPDAEWWPPRRSFESEWEGETLPEMVTFMVVEAPR